MELDSVQAPRGTSTEETHKKLRQLKRRNWWLTGTTVAVMLLLTVGTSSLSFSALLRDSDSVFRLGQQLATRGLFGVVLLFSVYMVYQQFLFNRLKDHLNLQMEETARAAGRAEAFERLSLLDPLTDFYNRRFADNHLPAEVSRARRHGYSLTVVALDLDGFKQINDRYGHAAGDLALKEFARRLKQATRDSDIPIRMGGDEFIVVLPSCTGEGVKTLLARLQGLEVSVNGHRVPVNFSAGWAEYQAGELPTQLLQRADQRLYADKRNDNGEKKEQ